MCAQSSPVLCTVYSGNDVGGCLGSGIVATWLSMILWPFSHIPLVLFMWNIGTLNVIPSYGCNSFACTSVLSGMTWISVWGGCLFARPGFILILDFSDHPMTWRRFQRNRRGGLLWYPPPLWRFRCLFYPRNLSRGGGMVLVEQPC